MLNFQKNLLEVTESWGKNKLLYIISQLDFSKVYNYFYFNLFFFVNWFCSLKKVDTMLFCMFFQKEFPCICLQVSRKWRGYLQTKEMFCRFVESGWTKCCQGCNWKATIVCFETTKRRRRSPKYFFTFLIGVIMIIRLNYGYGCYYWYWCGIFAT